MTIRLAGALGALMILGCFGCERRDEPMRETTTPVPAPAPVEGVNEPVRADPTLPAGQVKGSGKQAVEEITRARCAREQRCNNIGADRKFANQDACMREVREEWSDDLNAYECPAGINQDELSECLEEVRNEDCNNPFDTLGRIVACRSSDICQSVAPTR